ncbi:unnamed protein product [Rotaria sp. Silwood2]|nr:unnamed protein product [Rotaria sp. Silwood2]CAF3017831.1 unnamed protein product [Rotaria sp. Silwood2]CAF3404674.1 unnamed protein product [Rotaria sp. Silwood2]CAF4201460.1 unnamed protein product [Rotaria sp. Silwood2]CAF4335381.1 unnamed protein product [Rotaria sp. Silwood2]
MSISTAKEFFDKQEVEDLVKKNDARLSFAKPPCGKSSYWDKYQEVLINNVRQRYAICNDCRSILTWIPSNGTGVMKKHSVGCSKAKELPPETQPRITSSFKQDSQVTPNQLRSFKTKILRGAAEMCVLDSRPFNIFYGNGFEEFIKQIFDAGKYFGKMIDVKQLLPHRTTISRHVDRLYSLYHQQLRDLCKTITSFSTTIDFWTEDFSGISFAGVALHFYEDNKGLVSLTLCCRAYDLIDGTASNVRLFVDQILSEFNLKLTENQFVVSDNEPKMRCSFKENTTRVGCSCHYLNKILEKSFIHIDSNCNEIHHLFNTIRPIVTHFTRSHKQANLTRRLQLYCKVRWHSIYSMFFAFNENFPDLRSLLDHNHQQSFDTIDQDLLRQLLPFLKLIVDITERLSNEQQPILHLVIPCRQKLLQVANSSSSNKHSGLVEHKNYFIEHLENDWPIQDEHFIATVLHPQFKQLDFFTKRMRRHAHDLIKSKLRNDSTMSSPSSTIIPSSKTDCSNKNGLLSSLYDKPKDANKSKGEFEIYLDSDLRLDENADLLKFWMQQRENVPQLFQLAKQILIIPASKTCVELYLRSLHETNEKELSDDASHPLFNSNKRVLSSDLSSSSLETKRRRLYTDDESLSNEQYEQIHSDDDNDNDDDDIF